MPELFVPVQISRYHPVLVAWRIEHQERRSAANNEWRPQLREAMMPVPLNEAVLRCHRCVDTLLKALHAQGVSASADGFHRVSLSRGGTGITFEVQVMEVCGIRILTDIGTRQRRVWNDTAEHPLAARLTTLFALILGAFDFLDERSRKLQAAEEARVALEAQQRIERETKRREEARWELLVRHSRQWADLVAIRNFVEAVSEASRDEAARFVAWSQTQVLQRDPMQQLQALLREFEDSPSS